MVNPLVSIVICTLNRTDLLKVALQSIVAQSYGPVKIKE